MEKNQVWLKKEDDLGEEKVDLGVRKVGIYFLIKVSNLTDDTCV
jgi:hypothetical protein